MVARRRKKPEGPIEVGDFVLAVHAGTQRRPVEVRVMRLTPLADGSVVVSAIDVKEQKYRAFKLTDCTLLRKGEASVTQAKSTKSTTRVRRKR